MNESQELILSAARNFVTDFISHKVKPEFVFHNIEHTEGVADASSQMADHYRLNDDDRFVLMLAAWFHDTGYSSGKTEGHEEVSVQVATQFMHHHRVDDAQITRVSSAIMSTKMPQSPINLVEKILCDADLSHLASPDFKATSQLLKQERENLLGHKIPKKEWRKNNIQFLENHKYFTDYGQEILKPRKQENLLAISKKKSVKEEDESEEEEFPYSYDAPAADGNKNEILKAQQKNTERGIQTMFRTTSSNHFELSSLADSKSNIMISVNSIILSVTLTVLLARLAFYPEYIIPTIILMVVCLSSIIFAILATRPSVNKGKFTEDDIRNKSTNLLFFGNFHKMKLDEYQWAMNEMLKDSEYLYNSMIKDIYFLGVVLARKYKYLRISYTIFMWGIIAVVIAFVFAAITGNAGASPAGPMIDY